MFPYDDRYLNIGGSKKFFKGCCLWRLLLTTFGPKRKGIAALTSKFRELWSPARQQIWPWSRSKVKVTTWYHRKGLVTKNTHAKYQSTTCNSAKVMAKVKVFVTDGRTDRRTDRQTRFNVPAFSRKRGTKMAKMTFLVNVLVLGGATPSTLPWIRQSELYGVIVNLQQHGEGHC